MASYRGQSSFHPQYNTDYSGNYDMNPGMGRPPMRPFQRNPIMSYPSYHGHDSSGSSGMFPGRPRFSSFREPMDSPNFMNMPPAPEFMPPPNMRSPFRSGPPPPPMFSGGPPFEPPYRQWRSKPMRSNYRSPSRNRPRAAGPSNMGKNSFFNKSKNKKNKRMRLSRNERKLKEHEDGERPFSCDCCDRAYKTERELTNHADDHIKCDFANCTFEAHPKLVALHKKMQHDTGYAEVICKLQDDEDIEKWIAERKKRFPTAENILKRKAEQAEKEARGEVIETKEFGSKDQDTNGTL